MMEMETPHCLTDEQLYEKVKERQLLKEVQAKAEITITQLNADIGAELVVRGVQKLEVGEWRAQLVEVAKEGLDVHLLLQAGVTTEQIEKGKKITRFSTFRVDRRA